MPSSATSTQTVVIKTDVQIAYPTIVCPFTVSTTLIPSALYIKSAGNTISVDATKIILPSDLGTHTFILTVNSLNFSATLLTKTYSFNVLVKCSVTTLSITSSVGTTNYYLNQGALLTVPFTVVQASACNYAFTYTQSFTKNGLGISKPAWLTWDNSSQKFSMTITTSADLGVYIVTSTATIPQNEFSSNSAISKDYFFTLNVLSDCVNSSLTDKNINAMSNTVSATTVTQDVLFADSIATLHAIPAYCGARIYTFIPSLSFLTLSGTTLSLFTAFPSDVSS